MEEKHLLLTKNNNFISGFVLDNEVAKQILSQDTIRLFGKSYSEKDAFCEWFAVTSRDDGGFAGVCFVDFYSSATDSVIRDLAAENTKKNEDGWVVLLREVPHWEVQRWPYLPVHFLQTKAGDCCYVVTSAFGPSDQPPSTFKGVASLDEIAEPAFRTNGE